MDNCQRNTRSRLKASDQKVPKTSMANHENRHEHASSTSLGSTEGRAMSARKRKPVNRLISEKSDMMEQEGKQADPWCGKFMTKVVAKSKQNQTSKAKRTQPKKPNSKKQIQQTCQETPPEDKTTIALPTTNHRYVCSNCKKSFRFNCDLKRHSYVHKELSLACPFCTRSKFAHPKSLLTHINKAHFTELQHKCPKCGLGFVTEEDQQHHTQTNSKCREKSTYTCEYCQKTFKRKLTLQEHVRIHTGEKPLACELCDKKFRQRFSLWEHMQTHKEKRVLYKCPTCEKAFTRRSRLEQHVKLIHENIPLFRCDVCDKNFKGVESLRSHRAEHSGHQRFLCSICGYSCNWATSLKKHMITHSGILEHKCTECPREFPTAYELKQHMMNHTGNAPYECEKCSAKFKRNSHLKSHLQTHLDIRPFECHICKKTFRRRDNMETHLLTHSGKKPFECDLCGKRFNNPSNLRMHKVKVHKIMKAVKYERSGKKLQELVGVKEILQSLESGSPQTSAPKQRGCNSLPFCKDSSNSKVFGCLYEGHLKTTKETCESFGEGTDSTIDYKSPDVQNNEPIACSEVQDTVFKAEPSPESEPIVTSDVDV